jgi:epoxide hydrolase 4
MSKLVKVAAITTAILAALLLWVVYVFAPSQAQKLHKRLGEFRQMTQGIHDQIDKQYHHYYRQAGDVRWHYVEAGNPNGEVILLLHGLPEGFYSWHKVMPLLDTGYRIIAIDMKGYGRSTSDDNNYEWHHVGDQTLALMDTLGIRKFHIVGHDWGAIISSMMVGDHPERILSFVRMEADIFKPEDGLKKYLQKPQFLLFKSETIANLLLSHAQWFIDKAYNHQRLLTRLTSDERTYFIYEFSRPGVSGAVSQYFLSKNRDIDALTTKIAFNNFPFPVMQLQADSDPSQPHEIFDKIPGQGKNVKLKWINRAGHFSNIDQPQQVADAINEMVRSVKK